VKAIRDRLTGLTAAGVLLLLVAGLVAILYRPAYSQSPGGRGGGAGTSDFEVVRIRDDRAILVNTRTGQTWVGELNAQASGSSALSWTEVTTTNRSNRLE
jgi:hypothetical protein